MAGPAPGTYYYHLDPRGSVAALTDASGSTVYHTEYDAYGAGADGPILVDPQNPDLRLAAEPTGNPYFWQGRRLDSETGLYYYRNRYYDAEKGRLIHADPIGTWGDAKNLGNPYSFVGNVPGNQYRRRSKTLT